MDEDMAKAIRSIYGAVLDDRHWEQTLDSLVTAFGARGAVIVMQERGLPFEGFTAMSAHYRARPDIVDTYNREYAHHEASDWSTIYGLEPGKLFLDTDKGLCVDHIDAQPHYAYTQEHFAIRRRIAFRITDNPAWSDGIAFAYDAALDAAPLRSGRIARLVTPHLGQAIELGRTFSLLRRRYRAVVAMLDRLRVGIAVVLPSGEVVASNAEAARIFDEGDAIGTDRTGRIVVADEDKAAELHDTLRRCALTAGGGDDALAAPMHLDRPGRPAPLLLGATAMRDEGAEIEKDLAAAILVMIDMARPPSLDIGGFAKLYGLTVAETEVFSFMMEGDSTGTIAEKRGTSPHTAHNQARTVLGKTGCRNRNQLMRLVVQTLPPIF